jgi:hypothetical protein
MALVPIYHVVAASRAVDTAGDDIKMGMIVSLNSDGEVVKLGASNKTPYGIAGDTKASDASSMPGIASGWQNRVSDYFDETAASGKMTVYHSGGQFYTDQYSANVAALTGANIMQALYAKDGLLDTVDQDGATAEPIVARLIAAPGQIMSGVPGVDVNGDIALGSEQTNNNYIEIKLEI